VPSFFSRLPCGPGARGFPQGAPPSPLSLSSHVFSEVVFFSRLVLKGLQDAFRRPGHRGMPLLLCQVCCFTFFSDLSCTLTNNSRQECFGGMRDALRRCRPFSCCSYAVFFAFFPALPEAADLTVVMAFRPPPAVGFPRAGYLFTSVFLCVGASPVWVGVVNAVFVCLD